jgi:IclR family transcriptional regulator, acetate operon repressor
MDIKTAGRTLDLFEVFAREGRPLRLTEVASLMNAPVSSCHQLLKTLENRGYVYGLLSKSWYPTRQMLRNSEAIAVRDPLLKVLAPVMEELRDSTGESVLVAQQSGPHALLLEVVESNNAIRYATRPGSLRPLHCSGVGKALVGALPAQERDRWLPPEPYPRQTDSTLVTRAELDANLAMSARRGWYASLGESVPELCAVAVPLQVASGVFALSVAGPTSRMMPRLEAHAAAAKAAVEKMQSALAQGG